VKGIRPGGLGTAVVLNDSLAAQRLILEPRLRSRGPAEVLDTIARIPPATTRRPASERSQRHDPEPDTPQVSDLRRSTLGRSAYL
jgi:hypothetical protein